MQWQLAEVNELDCILFGKIIWVLPTKVKDELKTNISYWKDHPVYVDITEINLFDIWAPESAVPFMIENLGFGPE